jgi:predicted GNAT superfamily acetyltransferase
MDPGTKSPPRPCRIMRGCVEVRPVPAARLADCAELIRSAFAFGPGDTVPAHLLFAVSRHGGLVLGAFSGSALSGCLFALPAHGADRCLYLAQLAVRQSHRDRGIGLDLMHAMRDRALQSGVRRILWTTGSLASRNLHLYLNRCGARVVAVAPGLYAEVMCSTRVPVGQRDEVEVEWLLQGSQAATRRSSRPIVLTSTAAGRPGVRRLEGVRPVGRHRSCALEVPWDVGLLSRVDRRAAAAWRRAVTASLAESLAAGLVGTAVELDRGRRRAFLRLDAA